VILAVDVAYSGSSGVAAGVLLRDWSDVAPSREIVVRIPHVEDYVPGEFFRRELPCIEAVLQEIGEPLECVVVDGYVTLGDPPHDGLGAVLWNRLGQHVPVIGVAKSKYLGVPQEAFLLRGGSNRPLFVTAAGMTTGEAKRRVFSMAGAHRLPDMLKYVDGVTRRAA
jgi:deoxyribonuclease V